MHATMLPPLPPNVLLFPSEYPTNSVFVFGSNLAGRHGAGAARFAVQYWGAEYGRPAGLQGRSYAIPTKDTRLQTLPLASIRGHALDFIDYAANRPDLQFLMTPVGCGLAGYSAEQIAPLFGQPAFLTNVRWPKEFVDVWQR